MGKPIGHVQRAFVHSINPIWTKRMDHVHFQKIYILLKKLENVVTITIYSSSIFLKKIYILFSTRDPGI
jgi:hypothetical protein